MPQSFRTLGAVGYMLLRALCSHTCMLHVCSVQCAGQRVLGGRLTGSTWVQIPVKAPFWRRWNGWPGRERFVLKTEYVALRPFINLSDVSELPRGVRL